MSTPDLASNWLADTASLLARSRSGGLEGGGVKPGWICSSRQPRQRCELTLSGRARFWYGAIPDMHDDWLANLMKAFDEIVSEHAIFQDVYALI